jgi:hypothetical protein
MKQTTIFYLILVGKKAGRSFHFKTVFKVETCSIVAEVAAYKLGNENLLQIQTFEF